jgi:transposase, IS5 family
MILVAVCSREVHRHLEANGLKVSTGTIVDVPIIHAPSSTKNADQARDPDMSQTRKGNQWYFGMKALICVDSKTKVIDSAAATPANVTDCHLPPDLLHGKETGVWGDPAYRGQRKVIIEHAPRAKDFTNHLYRRNGFVDEAKRAKNRSKSKVRAKVEHVFFAVKGSPRFRQNDPLRRGALGVTIPIIILLAIFHRYGSQPHK